MAAAEVMALAVPAALAGAAAMGLANAAQAKATKAAGEYGIAGPRLVWGMLRDRTWLVGTAATVAGLVLQLVALAFGPLALVQPLLVTALLFTTVFVAWLRRGRVELPILLAALLCSAGLAAFLFFADPGAGRPAHLVQIPVLPVLVVVPAVLAGCFVLVTQAPRAMRVLGLALATGVLYGLTATLMKLVAVQFREGAFVPFGHWAVYAAAFSGVTGFLLSQHAFQQAGHAASAVAVITTVDPLVAMGLGAAWLGESIAVTPGALLGELLAGAAMVGGITLQARQGERLAIDTARRPRAGVTSGGCAVSSC